MALKKRTGTAYPKGILTTRYTRNFEPGTARFLTDAQLCELYPGVRLEDISVFARFDPGVETKESRERFNEIIVELARNLGITAMPGHPDFWISLAIRLMFRHVPAFQPRANPGRWKDAPGKHIALLREAYLEAERLKARAPGMAVFRAMARRRKKYDEKDARAVKKQFQRAEKALKNDSALGPKYFDIISDIISSLKE